MEKHKEKRNWKVGYQNGMLLSWLRRMIHAKGQISMDTVFSREGA